MNAGEAPRSDRRLRLSSVTGHRIAKPRSDSRRPRRTDRLLRLGSTDLMLLRHAEILQVIRVISAPVAVVGAGVPELGADVEVAVAVDIGDDCFVATEVVVEDDALDEVGALAVDVFPDEPARLAGAGDVLHLDGEDVEVAV